MTYLMRHPRDQCALFELDRGWIPTAADLQIMQEYFT